MTDSTTPKNHTALAAISSVCLILVAVGAGYLLNKSNSQLTASQEQVAALTSQLEDAQKQVAELQPLANRARTLPVSFRMDRHALTAGYTLYTFNQSRESLRFKVVINGGKTFPNVVIDGGKLWMLRGLASGDTVVVSSEGYDDRTVNIK